VTNSYTDTDATQERLLSRKRRLKLTGPHEQIDITTQTQTTHANTTLSRCTYQWTIKWCLQCSIVHKSISARCVCIWACL